MNEPKVIRVEIKGLIEDPDNPNKMTREDFEALCATVAAVGMVQPILVQEVEGGAYKIVDGHHRSRAAKRAKLTHVLAVVWDGTEEMRRAMGVSMNKLRGELDLSAVQKIITELHEGGWTVPQLAITGYSEDEITDLLRLASAVEEEDVMQNVQPAPTEEKEAPVRPLVLELTFASTEELQRAKRGLRRAAGKGRELGEGLLVLLGERE